MRSLNVLIGITGGIAAYKIPSLVRLLKKEKHNVKVILTETAAMLVSSETLQVLSENPVYTSSLSQYYDMAHIRLATWADLFIVCPATANTIAKIAHGIADNLLTSLALSFKRCLMIAPAMNTAMWEHQATQSNLDTLRKRGVRILPVGDGFLACGDSGAGRMISIETIQKYIETYDIPQLFHGKKILIASGPTYEPIDPVRGITNKSSGRMGIALATIAMVMGADVTIVTGTTTISIPEVINRVDIITTDDLIIQMDQYFAYSDICIFAAAIADFKPLQYSSEKIKRIGSHDIEENQTIALTATKDCAAYYGLKKKSHQFILCFSLESGENEERARKKMMRKGCDCMVLNSIENALGTDTNSITLLFPSGERQKFQEMNKTACAQEILLSVAKKII